MDIKVIGQGGQTNLNKINNEVKPIQANKDVAKAKSDNTKNKEDNEYKEKDLEKAVSKLNKFLEDDKTHAEYSVHDKFNTIMIKIIDDETDEVIMEVPPKKILDMVAKMCELVGIVFDEKA